MFILLKQTFCRKIICITGLVLLSALTTTSVVNAERIADKPTIMVILSDDTIIYQDFITAFKRTLVNNNLDALLEVLNANIYENRKPLISKKTRLIITVGVKAASLIADMHDGTPVYATLIPKDTFEAIQKSKNKKVEKFSAVFLDQPITRQFNLIRYALPHARRIGILVSETETGSSNSIIKAGQNADYNVILEKLTQNGSLPDTLDRIYNKSDVLLVVPEAGIIDSKMASNILLSSYRYQKPVVGYSHAYVKAGALLAVYSTPEQMGRYVALSVIEMKGSDWHLPDPSHSDLFTVSVNRWLARSLRLNIRSEDWLTKKMADKEKSIKQ